MVVKISYHRLTGIVVASLLNFATIEKVKIMILILVCLALSQTASQNVPQFCHHSKSSCQNHDHYIFVCLALSLTASLTLLCSSFSNFACFSASLIACICLLSQHLSATITTTTLDIFQSRVMAHLEQFLSQRFLLVLR